MLGARGLLFRVPEGVTQPGESKEGEVVGLERVSAWDGARAPEERYSYPVTLRVCLHARPLTVSLGHHYVAGTAHTH